MTAREMRSFGTVERVGYNSDRFYQRRIFGKGPVENAAGPSVVNAVPPETLDQLHNRSSEAMAELPDNCVHLMVTSPPYNVGKEYDEDLTIGAYLEFLGKVWRECHRVLVPGGRACINVANLGRRPYIPLGSLVNVEMLNIGFLMRGEIIWNKGAGAGSSCAWGSWRSPSNPVLRDTHEYVLVFSKDKFPRGKPKDVIESKTIAKDEFLELTKSVWTFPPESARKVGHPAPFPVTLPSRLLNLYTYPGEVVLDPFIGSGTTAVAAVQTGRRFVGYDTSADYLAIARDRIEGATPKLPEEESTI